MHKSHKIAYTNIYKDIYYCQSNTTITIQMDNNSTVNGMLFHHA